MLVDKIKTGKFFVYFSYRVPGVFTIQITLAYSKYWNRSCIIIETYQ